MEPKQVAGSKEGAPVTRKKPLALPRLGLGEGWRPPPLDLAWLDSCEKEQAPCPQVPQFLLSCPLPLG